MPHTEPNLERDSEISEGWSNPWVLNIAGGTKLISLARMHLYPFHEGRAIEAISTRLLRVAAAHTTEPLKPSYTQSRCQTEAGPVCVVTATVAIIPQGPPA